MGNRPSNDSEAAKEEAAKGNEKRILVYGMPNVGKSGVVDSIMKYNNTPVENNLFRRIPVFFNFKRFVMYDFCSDDEARDQWASYLKRKTRKNKSTHIVSGLVLVVDSSNPSSICNDPENTDQKRLSRRSSFTGRRSKVNASTMVDARSILDAFLSTPSLKKVSVLIVATNQDDEDAVSIGEVATLLGVQQVVSKSKRGIRVLGVSHVTSDQMLDKLSNIEILPDSDDEAEDEEEGKEEQSQEEEKKTEKNDEGEESAEKNPSGVDDDAKPVVEVRKKKLNKSGSPSDASEAAVVAARAAGLDAAAVRAAGKAAIAEYAAAAKSDSTALTSPGGIFFEEGMGSKLDTPIMNAMKWLVREFIKE